MKAIALKGTLRTDLGKKSTKALRNEGLVPCVIYGGGSNIHFSANSSAFRDLIYSNEFRIAEITLDGKVSKAIIKDIQFHPVSDKVLHIDLLELVDNQSVKADIPVKLVGSARGVKVGGVLMQKVRKLTVKTTPDKLTSSIEVDVTHLVLGKSIRVREVKVQEGVEVINAGAIPLATVEVPRALRSASAREAAENAQ